MSETPQEISPPDHFYSLIHKSLFESSTPSKIFTKLAIEKCRRATTIQALLRFAEFKTLQKWFKDAGFNPQVGMNLGTGDFSIMFALPTRDTMDKIFGGETTEKDVQKLFIWVMLGLFPFQKKLEHRAKKSKKLPNQLLANFCLQLFSDQSGITICERKIDLERKNIRIVIVPNEDLYDQSKEKSIFIYSPCYRFITAFDENFEFSNEIYQKQQSDLIIKMVNEFWKNAENKQHYVPVETLRNALSISLNDYLQQGWKGQSSNFLPSPNEPLNFYLCGTAGIGKSAFVTAFCKSLQYLLRRYIQRKKIVQIVKLPLNSISTSNLRSILRVKGISDMSIERVIEQTLCKGDIVIFHLEENPEDSFLQQKLFEQTQSMLDQLVERYPEYRGNIITIITSNYPPIDLIAAQVSILPMVAVSVDQQIKWCSLKLNDTIKKILVNLKFHITLSVSPPFTNDLRPLEQWWRSLAFQITRHLQFNQVFESLAPVFNILITGTHENNIFITFPDASGLPGISLVSTNSFFYYLSHSLPPPALSNASISLNQPLHAKADSQSSTDDSETPSEPLAITPSPSTSVCRQEEDVLLIDPVIITLIDMVYSRFLKPGVIVLTGSSFARERWIAVVLEYLYSVFRDSIRTTKLELFCEDDKAKVFGTPRDIMGGLFRFIDRVNNPNATEGREDLLGVIVAEVNEIGQFILRELMEPAHSKTHRQVNFFYFFLFFSRILIECL